MNSQDLVSKFQMSYQRLSDSLDQGLISEDAYDDIGNVMCNLYPNEARKISIVNGDMQEDDPIEMASAGLDELFETVADKAQFIKEFDFVIESLDSESNPHKLVQKILQMR